MLKAAHINKIADILRIKPADLTAAIAADTETDIAIDDTLTVMDDTELQRVKDDEYKSGKVKGVEMAVKEAAKKIDGLEFTGKTVEGLLDAANKKAIADAGVSPDKKVEALNKDLELVRKELETKDQKIAEYEGQVNDATTKADIFKSIPSLGEDAPDMDSVLSLMSVKGYTFKREDGELVAYKGENAVKDKVAKPIPIKDVIKTFAIENKLIREVETPAGRGAGDKGASPIYTKISEFKTDWEGQGKSVQGSEYSQKVREMVKANPEFDMNN